MFTEGLCEYIRVQALQKVLNYFLPSECVKIAMYLKLAEGLYDLQRCVRHTMVQGCWWLQINEIIYFLLKDSNVFKSS
jgi:hypothetical protein